MKRILYTLIIIIYSSFIYGQNSDTTSKQHFPQHYISINPLNFLLFQQEGLTYEYKTNRLGYAISTGYFFANKLNYSRFFITGTTERGPYEFYSGFYATPQINLYFSKPMNNKKATLCYISLKGVYKGLKVDSTEYHIWTHGSGDASYFYRKQVDRCRIAGAFLDFGVKCVKNHFVFDFNIGYGILSSFHRMVVAGEGYRIIYSNISNVNPPRHEWFKEDHRTLNISFNFGYAF